MTTDNTLSDRRANTATEDLASRTRRPFAQTAPLLTAEQEIALAARIRSGDQNARGELTLANLRLVLSIASEFRGRNRALDLDDLIQEGNLGLMRAACDFDPETHGTRFATYASYWIRHHIHRVLAEQSSMIRFPYYLVILRRRFEKTRGRLVEARRSQPSDSGPIEPELVEIAKHMGVATKRLKYVCDSQIDTRSYSTTSLDDASHDDVLAQSIPPEAPLEIAESMERLHAAMRRLTLLEAWVLRRRYRLDDSVDEAEDEAESRARRRHPAKRRPGPKSDGRRTYRELSREIGKPIHQLRQIERSAIIKLHDFIDPPVNRNDSQGCDPRLAPVVTLRCSA
ncbi:sigma-70 family RNA polymerase sigma factor [Paludisphaera mucosa]|uniref:Sigma-70 family RNA polymerase sigma factor n=1 Tax=Paludisphaera mucosa TaxID=3030827 RepID=A0ABT6FD22_9BACT|nr:sigma-70 family RNA polymerase sigma factor [Paludisphaera mucosa]MDG3005484.1 sigma-70 family RNA polymerase sigma factor [Paludisphaera mucosa]